MNRRVIAVILGGLVLSLLLAANGSSSQTVLPKLVISINGPSQGVAYGTLVAYSLTMSNTGNVKFNQVRLSLIPVDTIVRSSVPYKRSYRPIYKATVANWMLKNFKPGATYKVRLTLKFPKVKGTSEYGLLAEAMGIGPLVLVHTEKDVYFKKAV